MINLLLILFIFSSIFKNFLQIMYYVAIEIDGYLFKFTHI